MAKDTRWSAAIFITARSVQLFLAIIVMGIACYFATPIFTPLWYIGYMVAISLLTVIYICTNFALFSNNLLLPLAIVIIEPILFVLWAIGVAVIGIGNSDQLSSTCVYWYGHAISETCVLLKAFFALSTMELILLISTLVMASIAMHQTRNDPRGKIHHQQRKANRSIAMGAVVAPPSYMVSPQQYHNGMQQQHYQQQQPPYNAGNQQMYHQQPQQQQQYPPQPQYQQVNPQVYQQSAPGVQCPVHPPQPTGSPLPYQRDNTVSPLSELGSKPSTYNQGGFH